MHSHFSSEASNRGVGAGRNPASTAAWMQTGNLTPAPRFEVFALSTQAPRASSQRICPALWIDCSRSAQSHPRSGPRLPKQPSPAFTRTELSSACRATGGPLQSSTVHSFPVSPYAGVPSQINPRQLFPPSGIAPTQGTTTTSRRYPDNCWLPGLGLSQPHLGDFTYPDLSLL